MNAVNMNQSSDADIMNTFTTFQLVIEAEPEQKFEKLLSELSPDTPWIDRQTAARKLGFMRNPEALPGLLYALPADPFWMVRCAMIQSLETIGDPKAVPTLREVAKGDDFYVVRSYAAKAIESLSLEG